MFINKQFAYSRNMHTILNIYAYIYVYVCIQREPGHLEIIDKKFTNSVPKIYSQLYTNYYWGNIAYLVCVRKATWEVGLLKLGSGEVTVFNSHIISDHDTCDHKNLQDYPKIYIMNIKTRSFPSQAILSCRWPINTRIQLKTEGKKKHKTQLGINRYLGKGRTLKQRK